jgi:hypothetical protein
MAASKATSATQYDLRKGQRIFDLLESAVITARPAIWLFLNFGRAFQPIPAYLPCLLHRHLQTVKDDEMRATGDRGATAQPRMSPVDNARPR